MFLRLVSVTDDADDVRHRVRLSELRSLGLDREGLDRVLSDYGEARLVTFDRDPVSRGPTVEVAHEALLREWSLLRTWISEQREALIIQRRLTAAVDEWEKGSRDADLLPRGRRLLQFEEWSAEPVFPLTSSEREFIDAGITHRDQEARSRRTRRRVIMGAFASAALIAMVLAVLATSSATRARSLAALALVGDAEYLMTIGDTEGAAIGLAESHAIEASPTALIPIGRIVNGREVWGAAVGDDGESAAGHVAVDWDRGVAAVTGAANQVVLLDVADGARLGELPLSGHGSAIAFTNDGSLVTGDSDGNILVWDVDQRAATPIMHTDDLIVDIVVAPDDAVVVATTASVTLFSVGPGGPSMVLEYALDEIPLSESETRAETLEIRRVAVSGDGKRLLTMGSPLMIASWDIRSGDLLAYHLGDLEQIVWSAAFSPGDDHVITGHQDRTLVVRDAGTLAPVGLPIGPLDAQQRSLSFSPDGRTLISSGTGGVLVWTYSEGNLANPVPIGSTTALATQHHALSPGGDSLVAAVSDRVRLYRLHLGTEPPPSSIAADYRSVVVTDQATWIGGAAGIYHWDRSSGEGRSFDLDDYVFSVTSGLEPGSAYFGTSEGELGVADEEGVRFLADHPGGVWDIETAPGGEAVVSVGGNYTIVIRDPRTLQPLYPAFGLPVEDRKGFKAATFLDDETLATAGADGHLRVWDLTTRTQTIDVPIVENEANAVVALGDGLVAVGDELGVITVVDAGTGTVVRDWSAHTNAIRGMAVSPDGLTLASGSQDNAIRLWEVATWSQVGEMRHSGAVRAMVFADEGRELVAVDINGGAVVWDSQWTLWPDRLCEWLDGWDLSRSWPNVMGESRFDPACGDDR